jgi:hypothetical protein
VMQYGHKGPEARESYRLFIGTSDCHSVVRSNRSTHSGAGVPTAFVFEVTAISVETTLPC